MRRSVSVWNVLFTAAVVALLGWLPVRELDVLADVRE